MGKAKLKKILVVGDLINDLIVIPSGEIRPNTDTAAEIHKTLGGAAANVAAWLSHLGIEVTFTACVNEQEVEELTNQQRQFGVKAKLQSSPKPTGSLVVLVSGEMRSMLTDRGANADLNLDQINPEGYAILYLSGYALIGQAPSSIAGLIERSKQAGALVAIDPGSTGFIQDLGIERFRDLISKADLMFPNLEEEEMLSISAKVPLTVVTLGDKGSRAIFSDGHAIEIEAPKVPLIDPTGAGDAFCAGFLARLMDFEAIDLCSTKEIRLCLEAGAALGAVAVAKVGARP